MCSSSEFPDLQEAYLEECFHWRLSVCTGKTLDMDHGTMTCGRKGGGGGGGGEWGRNLIISGLAVAIYLLNC